MATILAIDDKEDNLITIAALLKSFLQNCNVITARSGMEGIERALEARPDTIILDVKMPEMDGYETCRRLKSMEGTRRIPVILLTAIRTDTDSRIRGLEIGADAFLTKPIDESELIAQIKVMLRIKEAEDMLRCEKDSLESLVQDRTRELSKSLASLRKERDFIRSLEDASPAYYVALHPDGGVIAMNRSLREALGYSPEEVIGLPYIETFLPEQARDRARGVFESIINNNRYTVSETAIQTRQGKLLAVEWHGRPFTGEEGRLEFVFFLGIDITERKRLERLIMSRSAQERHRIGQYLYDGLGQQLAIVAFKGEILKLRMKERSSDDVADIDGIIGQVNQCIDTTRDLARELFPVDALGGGLYSAFADLCAGVEADHAISCVLHFDDRITMRGDLETANIHSIVKEALSNAVQHGKAATVEVSCTLDEGTVCIQVRDDGIGIPPDIESRPGVGITIMRYRAWLIGATLSIRRGDAGGTEVTCTIKNTEIAPVASTLEENIKRMYLAGGGDKKQRVLIVDEHPVFRQGLAQIINGEADLGICAEAGSADEAVRLIASTDPHLVITDIALKGTNGIDLLKALKNRYAGLPVLILSIHEEALYAERAIRAGARGYVMKQEAPQIIVQAIRTVLAGKQYLSSRVKEKILNNIGYGPADASASPRESLTDREFEIFRLIGQGLQNRNIAEKLNISVKTVENFRERIKNKLYLESSGDLVQFAVQWLLENRET